MRRLVWPLAATVLVGASLLAALPTGAQDDTARAPDNARLLAYTVAASQRGAQSLRREHYDISAIRGGLDDKLDLEVIMTEAQAAKLAARGFGLRLNAGQVTASASTGARTAAVTAANVFRPWAGAGGLREETVSLTEQYPDITALHTIGESGNGTPILAIKVTKDASSRPDGELPTVIYVSTQHAREWISPEVNRRLLRHFLENYGTDAEITRLVDRHEFWFVLVANPDGYDYTFTEGNRLWRKTLRDNDGDGEITAVDGVDPNRNFPSFWGFDNEGSSNDPGDQTYRGPSPASEPETRALDALVARLTPQFLVNYHSAAELILYGIGHQVATPSPNDVILAALAGDDENSAVDGYDPDISAELYTANGTTTGHMGKEHGVLSYTPELSTCQTVSDEGAECESVFNFPDDEDKVQAEFEKNLAFALDVAKSAANPYEPVSHLGNKAADFVLDEFAISHGRTQQVQATVSRQIRFPLLRYRINDGRTRYSFGRNWRGGKRYGNDFNRYYRDVRARIFGLRSGDKVEYEWIGRARDTSDGSGQHSHRHHAHLPRYTLSRSPKSRFEVTEQRANVLIIANEDYDGVTPEQPDTSAPKYLRYYTEALDANRVSYNVWDLDAQGAPDALGVLAHYKRVIWYTGDNIVTQQPEDKDVLFPDSEIAVDEVMQYTTIAVRDYLNEGGKLLKTGDRAGYFGGFVGQTGGQFYAANGDETMPCTVPEGVSIFAACLLFSDDFHQYWLGDYNRLDFGEPGSVIGGEEGALAGLEVSVNGADSADNSRDAGESLVTSSVLAPAEYPSLPLSFSLASYPAAGADPFAPLNGDWFVGLLARNNQYNRFTRTIDLTDATAATLDFATSYDIESDYDFFVVEARTAGANDWTTLKDLNGNTPAPTLSACADGLWAPHPFLFEHYATQTAAGCDASGPTGTFNPFNGNSNGWVNASMDLSAFVGRTVEVSFTYVSDVGVANTGIFIDDVSLSVNGAEAETQGWEADQAPWAAAPVPAGSPASQIDWERSMSFFDTISSAAVATDDTLYLPFGFEAISTAAGRAEFMARALEHLETRRQRPQR